jgi:hypothetical protein
MNFEAFKDMVEWAHAHMDEGELIRWRVRDARKLGFDDVDELLALAALAGAYWLADATRHDATIESKKLVMNIAKARYIEVFGTTTYTRGPFRLTIISQYTRTNKKDRYNINPIRLYELLGGQV